MEKILKAEKAEIFSFRADEAKQLQAASPRYHLTSVSLSSVPSKNGEERTFFSPKGREEDKVVPSRIGLSSAPLPGSFFHKHFVGVGFSMHPFVGFEQCLKAEGCR